MKKAVRTLFKRGLVALTALSSLSACNAISLNMSQSYGSGLSHRLGSAMTRSSSPKRVVKSSKAANVIPDQVVVQFRTPPHPSFLQQYAQRHNLQVLRVSPLGTVLFRQLGGINTQVQSLNSSNMVAYSHKNTVYRRFFTVNDPRSAEQSGLAVIGMGKAWDITLGDPNVVIAIIDSGVDLKHPDLQSNLTAGFNVLSNGQTPPQDDNGHGTHAAGIAAAATDNNTGVAGACPRCKIMPIKALDQEGAGTGFDVAMAVVWAVDNGAKIINMSLGGPESDLTLERAVQYALSRGVSVVVAAGNENTDTPMYPAALPGVISVGSVDTSKKRSSFSNYGTWVSVMAPGSGILSTMPMNSVFMTSNEGYLNEYDLMDGTSMAAPMVAGVLGLIKSRHPQLSPAQLKARLEGSSIDLGAPGYDAEFGNGMVDAPRAIL